MKKQITKWIFSLCFVLFGSAYAQEFSDKVDSLKKVVESTTSDTVRINALFEWSGLIYASDIQLDIRLNKRIIEICKRHKKEKKPELDRFYKLSMSEADHNCGLDYLDLINYEACIFHYDRSYLMMKEVYDKNPTKENYKRLGSALMALGSLHSEADNFDYSIKYFNESLKVREELEDIGGIGEAHNNIGLYYIRKWFSVDTLRDESLLLKAKNSYQKGLEFSEKAGDTILVIVELQNLAKMFFRIDELDSSMFYFKKSIILCGEFGDPRSIGFGKSGLADVFLKQKKYTTAIRYAKEAYDLAERLNLPAEQEGPALILFKAWKELGNWKKALFYYEKHFYMWSAAGEDESKIAVLEQNARFDYRLKEELLDQKRTVDSLEIVQKNAEINGEKALRKKEEGWRIVLVIGVLLLIGLVAYIISRMRIIRKQKALLDEDYLLLRQFTENASHEMQTPMAVIQAKIESLLQNPSLKEGDARNLQSIHKATYKMSTMNRSLLLLAKIENKQFSIEENVNFSTICKETMDDFNEMILGKKISIETSIEEKVVLSGNTFLTELLVSNLIKNAIFHNAGAGFIHVSLTKEKFVVENSGLPLTVDTKKLFERFEKSSDHKDSTGLGLALAKESCKAMNWTINYDQKGELHRLSILFSADF